ncbi:MAG TPA: cation diffusion facilitator family transporter [Symbiobacteriaceae bacterium]|nr:cation diffusion facilitator family transporter [Symbiobacteriaceae bacterium]
MGDATGGYRESQKGAWVSILSYVILTALKLGAGWWAGSKALTADGVNNLTDVIGSVAVLLGLRIAMRPADDDHRYGHQRAETVAAVVVATVMGLVGLDVAMSAAATVFRPDLQTPHPAAVVVGLGSAAVMSGVYLYNIRLAKATGSKALAAAAYDNRSDALTSLGAVAGIIGAQLGWRWTDPVAGVVVAAIIIRTAWHIGAEAAHALSDGAGSAVTRRFRDEIAGVAGVASVVEVRARYMGNLLAVDVTIGVAPHIDVVEAHEICDRVEQQLRAPGDVQHVHVHVEPYGPRLGALS